MIEKPKKERRFLKTLGKIGEILLQEVLLKVGSNLVKRIGGKKTLPSILFLFISISIFAQFPNTGNKQRLGFQTSADGLVWRGSISDTASIQPVSNQNAWVILDTVNLKLYSFDFTSNVWNQLPSGSTVDTTSLSNRINLKLNISDTAAMLLPYAKKSYVDTAGRFYARQDFTNVSSSTLTWTQTDTLVPAGVNVIQVYRNGQILLPTQYTIPTNASVVIGSTAFKLGENYTVIFPKGGGGAGSGGSGSLTSISGGTGITVSPNPITTTGTVSADLTVLMELSDTVTLSNRINNKVNISDTASMLLPYFRDADTSSLNLTSRFALKLNAADTASLSSRINTKGTVSSVATGFGLLGGTITTTGTLRLDTTTIYERLQDSINVAIGNDTIKILKQEYNAASTSVLTWTITPKFPIQLKAYILVFRNGQLLNNDQYNLTDTNKITIVSTSFKISANYTVATVSGIGSIGTGVFPNPIYPEAGIALSTGSAWASSITNNSSNWNIAYNDKINNAAFTGTDTKTLTLTQLDGGTLTPTFTDLQGVTGVTAGTGLTGGTITTTGTVAVDFAVVAPLVNPTFTGTVGGITKSMVGLGNVDNTSDVNKPISTATQTALNLKLNISDTSSMLSNYNSRINTKLNISDTTSMLLPYFRDADTSLLNLTSRFATKLNISDTSSMLLPYFKSADTTSLNLTNRFNTKLNISDTTLMLSKYLRRADTTLLNLTSRFATKLNISDTSSMLTPYFRDNDTTQLNLTSRFAAKQNTLTNPVTGTGTTNTLPLFTGTSTLGNSVIQESSGNIGIGVAPIANLTFDVAKNILLKSGSTGIASVLFSETGTPSSTDVEFGGILRYNGSLDRMELVTRDNLGGSNVTNTGLTMDRITGNIGLLKPTTISSTLTVTGAITENGNNVLTNLDTASLSSRIDAINSGGNQIAANNNTSQTISNLSGISNYYLGITSDVTITITLPSPSLNNNKMITIKNTGTGAVNSASSNVQPLKDPAPPNTLVNTNEILLSGGGKWTTMVSNGFEWVKMAGN